MKTCLPIIIFGLVTIQAVFGQSLEKSATKVPEGWKELKGENYWMIYPEEWELNSSGEMGSTFVVLSPVSSADDRFRENVNLMIQDLKGYNVNLAKYTEVSEEQIRTLVPEGNIIESTLITGNILNYQKTIYTGKQGDFDMIFEQYYWVEDEKAFVLSFTSEENQYEMYKSIGEKMLNSFQLFVH